MGVRPLGFCRRIGQVNNFKVGKKEAETSILKEINITDLDMDSELELGKE